MALKQIIFSEDCFSQLPEIIHLLQTKSFPVITLNEVFSHVSTLIYGTYSQRKIGLAVLKCCVAHLYTNNRLTENIDYMLKWWKGVVNCLKLRYTPDCTYRLACVNATILAKVSANFVDLQIEGRANVPVMISAALSHLCEESFELLMELTRQYPSHVGKHYDETRAFCLAHVYDGYCESAADLLGRLACVGPAGKQSINYVQSWNKMVLGCLDSLKSLLLAVLERDVTEKPTFLVLQTSKFNGEYSDIVRFNKEVSFLTRCMESLFDITIDAPTNFPIKCLKEYLELLHTAHSETLLYSSTSQNFVKKSIINHSASKVSRLLLAITPVLHTTVFLIQPALENVCLSMIQQSHDSIAALQLLNALVQVGCTLHIVPYVSIMDFLSLQNLQIRGPVSKKQKTEQFNSFNFETSTLGVHDEGVMAVALKILNQTLKSAGTTVPSLKLDILEQKCKDIIGNKDSFSVSLVQLAYKTLINTSRQSFNVQSVFNLSAMAHDTTFHTFLRGHVLNVEPHLHPERFSFRQGEASVTTEESSSQEVLETPMDDMWNQEMSSVFQDAELPVVDGNKSTISAQDNTEDQEKVPEITEGGKEESSEDSENEEMETDLMGDSEILEKIKADYVKVKESSAPVLRKEPLKEIMDSNQISFSEKTGDLSDILSAFVDAPASGDEA